MSRFFGLRSSEALDRGQDQSKRTPSQGQKLNPREGETTKYTQQASKITHWNTRVRSTKLRHAKREKSRAVATDSKKTIIIRNIYVSDLKGKKDVPSCHSLYLGLAGLAALHQGQQPTGEVTSGLFVAKNGYFFWKKSKKSLRNLETLGEIWFHLVWTSNLMGGLSSNAVTAQPHLSLVGASTPAF